MKKFTISTVAALTTAVGFGTALAAYQSSYERTPATTRPDQIKTMALPLEFPVVGNIEAVQQWRFGRLEQIEQQAGSPDIVMQIRTANGESLRILGPTEPLVGLARESFWFSEGKTNPGKSDYVERMIAFDVDQSGRLIAMMSLEPIERSQAKLRRAICSGSR